MVTSYLCFSSRWTEFLQQVTQHDNLWQALSHTLYTITDFFCLQLSNSGDDEVGMRQFRSISSIAI